MTAETEALLLKFLVWLAANKCNVSVALDAWEGYQAGYAAAKAETTDVGEPVIHAITA